MCSLRIDFEVFADLYGHSYDVLINRPWFLRYGGQGIVETDGCTTAAPTIHLYKYMYFLALREASLVVF